MPVSRATLITPLVVVAIVGVAIVTSCSSPPAVTSEAKSGTIPTTTTIGDALPPTTAEPTTAAPTTAAPTTVAPTTAAPTTTAPTTTAAPTTTEAPTTVPPTDPPTTEVLAAPPTTAAPAPPPPPPPAPRSLAVASSSIAANFFDMTNATRASIGVRALRYDADLEAYAQNWAQVMMNAGKIYHSQISNLLGSWSTVGENVGVGPTAAAINAALIASPPHYENISYPAYTSMGVGVATDASGRIYTAHIFAA